MLEHVAPATILRAQGEPTRVVLGPGKAPAAQSILDRTSVFLRKTMVLGPELLVFSKGKLRIL